METRGLGQESQGDRAFTLDKFRQLLDLVAEDRHRAMMTFQFHLIGRMDDMAHMNKKYRQASADFSGYLCTKLCWLNNVFDESNSPWQILLGSLDTKCCVLLNLAIFLEKWTQDGDGGISQWLFVDGRTDDSMDVDVQNKEANKGKDNYANALTAAIKNHLFKPFGSRQISSKLGSHSIRKMGTTFARLQGVSRDNIDYRARWKSSGRQQDAYTDIQLNWPDACCANKLSVGGSCQYIGRDVAGLTDEWLCANVTPNICRVFDAKVAAILALPLLWAAYDLAWSERLDPVMKHSIISKFIRLQRDIPDGVNPVRRVEILAMECK